MVDFFSESVPSDELPRPSRRRLWLLLCLAILLSVFYLRRSGSVQPPDPGNTRPTADLSALEHLKTEGIGHLENAEYVLAHQCLTTIANQLPEEPLGLNNLTICHLLALESGQIEASVALGTANRLVDRFPESMTANLLAGQMYQTLTTVTPDSTNRAELLAAAVQRFQRAVQLKPGSTVASYALYQTARNSENPDTKLLASEALRQVHRHDAFNLWVLADMLDLQTELQDGGIVATLHTVRRTLKPMLEDIQAKTGINILACINRTAEAALAGDWESVASNSKMLGDAIRMEQYAQIDRCQISPHPLSHVIHRFSASCYTKFPRISRARNTSTQVRLEPLPLKSRALALPQTRDLIATDFDRDGTPDLVVLHADRLSVLQRETPATPWMLTAQCSVPQGVFRILSADIDHRNGPDFVLFGPEGAVVVRNDLQAESGTHSLTLSPQDEEFVQLDSIGAATLIDLDQDDEVDIVFASTRGVSIWRNRGNLTFSEIGRWSELPPTELAFSEMMTVDWDRDFDFDVVLAGSGHEAIGCLENVRHGKLRWQPFSKRFGELQAKASSVKVIECDGNVSWDLLTGGEDGIHLIQTKTPRPGLVVPLLKSMVTEQEHRILATWDYDNDGCLDVLTSTSERIEVFQGLEQGRFRLAEELFTTPAPASPLGEVADLDGDGDLDVLLALPAGPRIYENQGGNNNRWLQLRLVDNCEPEDFNLCVPGALLEMRSGLSYQAEVSTRPIAHFGLGQEEMVDTLRILTTTGTPKSLLRPQPNRMISVEAGGTLSAFPK